MATVRASCEECGDVELTTGEIRVQVCSTTGASTYSFQCPACSLIVNKAAPAPIVKTLLDAGARLVSWDMPAELSEPKAGPPITHDDLLAFHQDLMAGDWADELASYRNEPTSGVGGN